MFNRAFLLSVAAVLLSGFVAFLEGNFSHAQQVARGINDGLSFCQHLGMWSDLFLIPFVVGIIWCYRSYWSRNSIAMASAVSFIITALMHYVWMMGAKGQEHILSPNGLTWSGWLHFVYMAVVYTLIVLYYFATSNSYDRKLVSVLLALHVLIAVAGVSLVKSGSIDAGATITTILAWTALYYAVRRSQLATARS